MSVEPNRLIVVSNPFDPLQRKIVQIDYDPAQTISDLIAQSGLGSDSTVIMNGETVKEEAYNSPLMPGDIVHVFASPGDDRQLRSLGMLAVAVVAYYAIGPYVSGAIVEAGYSAAAAEIWGSLAATAVVAAGGMLINGNLAQPALNIGGNVSGGSPTYGWSVADNTASEGIAIPVIYGNEATYPQIINQYLEVDSNYDQWWHALLCVGEGETNNEPTAEDIKLGDQSLTVLDEDDYILGTTDGSASPSAYALTKFDKLHQMYSIGKEMVVNDPSAFLLHFNGDDESTDILDDGVGAAGDWHIPGITSSVNTWGCQNTAALSTDHPFVGSANLNLETNGDYIYVDQWITMAIWTKETWDFEVRFRQDVLTDCAIAGQYWVEAGVQSYFWGIFYNSSGQLVFQQWKKDTVPNYTAFFDVKVSASLSIDTWHHVRVARSNDYIYIFLDGTLLGSATYSTTPEYPAGDTTYDSGSLSIGDTYLIITTEKDYFFDGCGEGQVFIADSATTLDANNTVKSISDGSYVQWIGRADYYDSTGPSNATRYGQCELDEARLTINQLNYSLVIFTPPTNPLADAATHEITTKGSVDSFTITVTCPYGLFYADVDGGLDPCAVDIWVSYRPEDSTEWTRQMIWIWKSSRNPVVRQWTITPSAGRGKYVIKISRITWAWELTQPSDRFQTTAYFTAIDEILDEFLMYPYLQLVSLSVKAQEKLSGRMPPIRITSNRTSIDVPNFSGAGTRTVDPTNNANAAFDMLTNEIYGIGLDPNRLTQSYWDDWYDWCAGTVGGNRRCQLNMSFDAQYSLDDAIQHVEACGRARLVNRGSKIIPIIDKPDSAVALFCNENIVPGTSKTTWIRQAERTDAVEISFRDKNQDFVDQSVFYPGTGYYALDRTPRVMRLSMLGINNRDQATREAILRQQISENTKRSVGFQSGIEALDAISGDVINFASKGNILAFSGRLARGSSREEEYTGTTVYLDKQIYLDTATYSGNCILIVRNNDNSIDQYTVSGPFDTDTWSITVGSSGTFEFFAPWIIGRTNEKYLYKINSLTRSSTKDVSIKALQYVAGAYYNSEYESGGTAI